MRRIWSASEREESPPLLPLEEGALDPPDDDEDDDPDDRELVELILTRGMSELTVLVSCEAEVLLRLTIRTVRRASRADRSIDSTSCLIS